MKKNICLFLLFLLWSNINYAQKESYVSLSNIQEVHENVPQTNSNATSVQTNKVEASELKRQRQALEFASEQEKINEQKRKDQAERDKAIAEREDILNQLLEERPQRNHEFQPINAIVLDAGHGGKTPGGVANGIIEKNLVFTLMKKLHAKLRKENRKITIYVTRKNDSFVSLEERVSKTTRWSARKNVLFISIHANIASRKNVEGFEIYTLSDRASDPDALATERLENAGFSKQDLNNTEANFSLLADLIRDGTRKQSEWLAKYIYDETLKQQGIYGRGLRRANFYVLKFNTVPSILIEVGYMSNPVEAKKLKSEEFQDKLVDGMYEGITKFIKEYNETEGFIK